MARSLKKNPTDLSELPTGWNTRKGLISVLCLDPFLWENWNILHGTSIEVMAQQTDENLMNTVFVFNSWKLTLFGGVLLAMTYKHWSLKNPNNTRLNGRVLVNMGRILGSPWYLKNSEIVVWTPEAHFELSMFDGDVHRFVDFNAPK